MPNSIYKVQNQQGLIEPEQQKQPTIDKEEPPQEFLTDLLDINQKLRHSEHSDGKINYA